MDLARIDLNLLVSLDVLLAERSVTRAAHRLHLSQPALSSQLKQLRAMLGAPLLLPASRSMTPTARALALQAPLRELLAQVTGLLAASRSFEPAQAAVTYRVATTDHIQSVLCVPLVDGLRQVAPDTRLALLLPDRHKLVEQMASGEVDLALLNVQNMPEALKTRLLYRETFLCVMRSGHPAARKRLDLDRFCGLEHVLVSPMGGGFVGTVDEALGALGRSRRVVVSVPSFLVVPTLVANTDLVCTLPARLARQWQGSLRIVPPPVALAGFDVHMGWHPRTHGDPAQIWLRGQVEAVAAEL